MDVRLYRIKRTFEPTILCGHVHVVYWGKWLLGGLIWFTLALCPKLEMLTVAFLFVLGDELVL